jgi:hypothetical protein
MDNARWGQPGFRKGQLRLGDKNPLTKMKDTEQGYHLAITRTRKLWPRVVVITCVSFHLHFVVHSLYLESAPTVF